MEKFFIHILDAIKYLEIKAQEKSQRKKYWVLGNQYLQPVDDVDEEKKCLDYDFKKKAQCVYEAARCGMKEGVLTGVFLGGFYGLIKNLNENVSNALIPSSLSKVNSSEEGIDQNEEEKNLTVNEKDNNITAQSENNNHQPQNDFREQRSIGDNALKNKKRGKSTFTKSRPPDRGRNNEPKKEIRPNSAGQSANENLYSVENVRPNTVMNVENNKSKSSEREKVEFVGYAFVQTFETRDSESSSNNGSDDSDKRKGDNQKKENENESQNRSEPKNRVNSDQEGRSSGSTYPNNVVGTIKEVRRRKKLYQKDTDGSKIEQTKVSSSSSSSQESYPAQVLLETKSKPNVEDSTNEKKDLESENKKDMKTSDQPTRVQSKQKPVPDKGKIGFNKGSKKNVLKGSRLSIKSKESKDSKSDIKHGDKSNKSKSRFSKSEKGSGSNRQKKSEASKNKPVDAFYDNIFISNKISKSILVDADVISNGYSLSLNNESLNSDEEFDHLSESNFNILDASGQRMRHIIEHSKASFNDDDTISYTQKKKLVFVEPKFFSLSEEPSTPLEPSSPPLTRIPEDSNSSNSESVDSITSDSKSGQAIHTRRPEDLHEPVSVQSIQSIKKILGDNQPSSGQSVKPSSKSTVVGSTGSTVVSGCTSQKAMSIGDSAPTIFVQNNGSSNRQNKELREDKNSDTEIIGRGFTMNKVRSVKESEFSGAPKSGYRLLKSVSDSLILLSACNCAVVLGVLCAVINTTKASLSF